MATLEEMIRTENCFYSVRSDNSMLLVLKIDDTVMHRTWMLIRTDTEKKAQSDEWPLSKIGNKEAVQFPALATDELKKSAYEGDFLEWLPGCAAPPQSEAEILLSERERLFEKRIAEVSSTLSQRERGIEVKMEEFQSSLDARQLGAKGEAEIFLDEQIKLLEKRIAEVLSALGQREQGIEAKMGEFQASLDARQEEVNSEAETFLNERTKLLEEQITEVLTTLGEQKTGAEARMQTFFSELEGTNSKHITAAGELLGEVQQESERVKGEVKYFQVTLEEKRKDSLTAFEQRRDQAIDGIDRAQRSLDEKWEESMTTLKEHVQQAQSLFAAFQSDFSVKEQTLTTLVATQIKGTEEKVQELQQALAEQQPLSEAKHRQDLSRRTSWITFWFVAAGIIFFVVTMLTGLFLPVSVNTILIEIFSSVTGFASVALGGITFLVVGRKG